MVGDMEGDEAFEKLSIVNMLRRFGVLKKLENVKPEPRDEIRDAMQYFKKLPVYRPDRDMGPRK